MILPRIPASRSRKIVASGCAARRPSAGSTVALARRARSVIQLKPFASLPRRIVAIGCAAQRPSADTTAAPARERLITAIIPANARTIVWEENVDFRPTQVTTAAPVKARLTTVLHRACARTIVPGVIAVHLRTKVMIVEVAMKASLAQADYVEVLFPSRLEALILVYYSIAARSAAGETTLLEKLDMEI